MPTITKTLLNGASDGFSLQSNSGFDSASVVSNSLVCVENNPASPGSYSASFRQGATANRYSDWGVPSGMLITHIKLLGFAGVLIDGSSNGVASGSVQIWTDDADLGSFAIDAFSTEGSLVAINKTSGDYVRVQVDISGNVDFDLDGYGVLEEQVSQIQIQVTYENADTEFQDSAGVSDTQSVSGTVSVSDSVSVSDANAVEGTFGHSDNVSVSEGQNLEGTFNVVTETTSVTDTQEISGTIEKTDNVSTAETVSVIDISSGDLQDITEGINISELVEVIGVSFQLEDGAQIGDAVQVDGVVTVSESIRVTDNIDYEATLILETDTYVDEVQNEFYL